MLFMKIYISLNVYDFCIASFALLAVLYLFSLKKVIYLCFKVYSGIFIILGICYKFVIIGLDWVKIVTVKYTIV